MIVSAQLLLFIEYKVKHKFTASITHWVCHPELCYCWSCFCLLFLSFFCSVCSYYANLCRFLTCAVVIIRLLLIGVLLVIMTSSPKRAAVYLCRSGLQLVWHHPISYYYQVEHGELVRHHGQHCSTVETKLLGSFMSCDVLLLLWRGLVSDRCAAVASSCCCTVPHACFYLIRQTNGTGSVFKSWCML